MNPLRKCIGISGPSWMQGAILHRERYSHPSTRAYTHPTLGARTNYWKDSRSTWLKVWIDWAQIQTSHQPDVWTTFTDLNNTPNLTELDKDIKQANVDGIPVVLTVFHAYPDFSNGGPNTPPLPSVQPNMKAPTRVDMNSDYGYFVLWLLARYRFGAPANPAGPNTSNPMGNTQGAYITALEPVNEPNLNMWTHEASTGEPARRDVHLKAAGMMKTAHSWSTTVATWTWTQPPIAKQTVPTYIFGPATSDANFGKPWDEFTADILPVLSGWPPAQVSGQPTVPYVGWSHHNYADIKSEEIGDFPPGGATRVENVRVQLYLGGWKSVNGGNKYIWLTEGGYKLPDDYSSMPLAERRAYQSKQLDAIRLNYPKMLAVPDVRMYTNHGMDDLPAFFKTYFRDDFNINTNTKGAQRMLMDAWVLDAEFPGATTP